MSDPSLDAATYAAVGTGIMVYMVFILAIAVLMIVSMWKLFGKAGQPGWAAIVPFYNMYVLFKISFGNGWFFLFMLIPIVNFVFMILLYVKLAKAFGKGGGYAVGLIFLGVIFMPMLAFGSSTYVGPQ